MNPFHVPKFNNKITHSLEYIPLQETGSSSNCQGIPRLLWTRMFFNVLTTAYHGFLDWYIQIPPVTNLSSIKTILILSFYPNLCFLGGFPAKFYMHFLHVLCALHALLISLLDVITVISVSKGFLNYNSLCVSQFPHGLNVSIQNNILSLITRTVCGDDYGSRRSSLCCFLRPFLLRHLSSPYFTLQHPPCPSNNIRHRT
jgi:hypothetical protein